MEVTTAATGVKTLSPIPCTAISVNTTRYSPGCSAAFPQPRAWATVVGQSECQPSSFQALIFLFLAFPRQSAGYLLRVTTSFLADIRSPSLATAFGRPVLLAIDPLLANNW